MSTIKLSNSLQKDVNGNVTLTGTFNATTVQQGGTNLSTIFASSGHNHNTAYAPSNHNHNSLYATTGHNHDTAYYSINGGIANGSVTARQHLAAAGGWLYLFQPTAYNNNITNTYWRITHDTGDGTNLCGALLFWATEAGNQTCRAYIEDDAGNYTLMNFTEGHRCVAQGIDPVLHQGLIVKANGQYKSLLNYTANTHKENITINEALPMVELCTDKKCKSVFGVVRGPDELNNAGDRIFDNGGSIKSIYTRPKDENGIPIDEERLFVNSIGEGAMWVCSANGNLENGDYIQSSHVPGYGEKQDDDVCHSYTIAKLTCDVDWNDPNLSELYQTRVLDDDVQAAFVGVVYSCGV